MCVRGIDLASDSTILRLDFGTAPKKVVFFFLTVIHVYATYLVFGMKKKKKNRRRLLMPEICLSFYK